jgi:hypothetical protein
MARVRCDRGDTAISIKSNSEVLGGQLKRLCHRGLPPGASRLLWYAPADPDRVTCPEMQVTMCCTGDPRYS